ncbi:MAG: hypothetical protein ABW318_01640 [Vicinamibacterales bacterium]|jgi:hypothetical protein
MVIEGILIGDQIAYYDVFLRPMNVVESGRSGMAVAKATPPLAVVKPAARAPETPRLRATPYYPRSALVRRWA